MKSVRRWWIGVVLGLICGGLPLWVAQFVGADVDPFDHGVSYLVWVGGSFVAAAGLAYFSPLAIYRWVWGVAVLSGFLGAILLDIVVAFYDSHRAYQLLPLTVVFSTIIGAPPAFLGAYLGAKLRPRDAHSD